MIIRNNRKPGGLAAAGITLGLMLGACGSSDPVGSTGQPPLPGLGPSRCGDVQTRPWCDTRLSPAERTALLLGEMTLSQKLSLLGGDNIVAAATGDPYVGISEGIPELGIPDLRMSDGPVGVRGSPATAFPTPLALASSFNPELARRTGKAVANEVRHKGNDLLHAPVLDIMRNPLAGRTFETYGEDPYLAERLGVAWIQGAQTEGIMANVKHYAMNTQEGQIGLPPITSLIGGRQLVNHVIDERTLREMHLAPFEAAIHEADVASFMCAYGFVNGAAACGSHFLLQQVLRDEWGFDGFVVSDYVLAVKDTVMSLNNGTEIEMPLGMFYTPLLLQTAVLTGLVSMETVDTRVGNILRTLFRFGFFDRADYVRNDDLVDVEGHAAVARETAEQGAVLLRNNGVLPLDAAALRKIAVIGSSAVERPSGGGSSAVVPLRFVPPRDALAARAASAETLYADGSDAAAAAALAATADVAIVFVADKASEGVDKTCLSLDCPALPLSVLVPGLPELGGKPQDALIRAVAATNPNTVVVLQVAGPVLTPWRDQVAAILVAWYPGQEAGDALAHVLFGDTDAGGRLPLSFPKAEVDTPTAGNPLRYPGVANQAFYTEGIFTGYRWYDEQQVEPAFPFGYGLSYTQFAYEGLQLEARRGQLLASLTVRNTGSRAGWATPQLYLGLPSPSESVPQPQRVLKGFSRHWLAPGASARASFILDQRAFSYWHVSAGGWKIADGCYAIQAGAHSRDLPLRATASWTQGTLRVGACS
ncbi:glycoside hydrolase family 3 C-terminal domain-containing protein [Solimonas sp. SE-A11]|uniref:beta-glucosidase n=1 Tax=Solimonas sp. SE-A11 TaxID=3054954 RepID=UPI00259D2837|nr:glycoside hydrolase family 3 C-terminal domain-containing protein [Solimonas sp. SE-A11]MDM4769444.1 glycoside hydrolase family 3 C-terminal domain-containing protein [Solimonas sp. SE-A11]